MTQVRTTQEETIEENNPPKRVIRKTQVTSPENLTAESPKKVFKQKKVIFRFYQVIWYILTVVEFLLGFRFFFKAFNANPFSGFTTFIYGLTEPLTLPFQGIFGSSLSSGYNIEWSTIIAMVIYALVAFGLVEFFQFVKPVTEEEVEEAVNDV